jgi:hypothetical protein
LPLRGGRRPRRSAARPRCWRRPVGAADAPSARAPHRHRRLSSSAEGERATPYASLSDLDRLPPHAHIMRMTAAT